MWEPIGMGDHAPIRAPPRRAGAGDVPASSHVAELRTIIEFVMTAVWKGRAPAAGAGARPAVSARRRAGGTLSRPGVRIIAYPRSVVHPGASGMV
jgi:hypothetical protein